MRDAADDGVAVGQPGQAGQVLAEERAGDGGRRWRANSPRISGGGVGLGVPGLELALPAVGVDEDDRFRPAKARHAAACRHRGRGFRHEAQTRQAADPQPFAPVENVIGWVSDETDHGWAPSKMRDVPADFNSGGSVATRNERRLAPPPCDNCHRRSRIRVRAKGSFGRLHVFGERAPRISQHHVFGGS